MRKFMIIWMGELISTIGSGMTAFAVSIYVYQLTGSATWVSIAALLAYVPTILMNPVGGILADRYDRRVMMICGDTFSALGLLFILICIQSGNTGALPVVIGVAISSFFIGILEPAYKATVTDFVTEADYAKASSLVQIAGSSKYLISPAIAGIILSVADIRVILIIDIATILVTVLATASVRKGINEVKPINENFNFFKEFHIGIKSITGDKVVFSLVVLMFFMCFFVAFIQTLMTPMILAFADSRTLGIMESISAVGMLIGSIVIGIINIKKGFSRILIISLIAAGVFMSMAGTTTNIWLIMTYCIMFFSTLPFVNTCADVLIRSRIPNDVQGRAWGMISVITQAGYVVAYAICGVSADYIFRPMLMQDGIFAGTVGRIIGTGEGRGIGFMFIVAGIMMSLLALAFGFNKNLRRMEGNKNELVNSKK
ncbi:MAG: macrolide transporter [Sedimentibacter sp.]|jgi:MFS family permease|nr:macrolide transporter [Sedimentibacter sp.]